MTDAPRDPTPPWLTAQADQLNAAQRKCGPITEAIMNAVYAEAEREDLAALDGIEGPDDIE